MCMNIEGYMINTIQYRLIKYNLALLISKHVIYGPMYSSQAQVVSEISSYYNLVSVSELFLF